MYWYIGTLLLKTEIAVKTATFRKENVTCTDTNNFTLVASNGIGNDSTAWLELIVNCKYRKFYTHFLGRDIMFAYFDDPYKRFTKIKITKFKPFSVNFVDTVVLVYFGFFSQRL